MCRRKKEIIELNIIMLNGEFIFSQVNTTSNILPPAPNATTVRIKIICLLVAFLRTVLILLDIESQTLKKREKRKRGERKRNVQRFGR
jgi:hypothetical protein